MRSHKTRSTRDRSIPHSLQKGVPTKSSISQLTFFYFIIYTWYNLYVSYIYDTMNTTAVVRIVLPTANCRGDPYTTLISLCVTVYYKYLYVKDRIVAYTGIQGIVGHFQAVTRSSTGCSAHKHHAFTSILLHEILR